MKRNKGFTLIELLVVVAIIGSLAAVGVVAYNGYTAAAKKNSSKAIHANIVKYIASEMAKCNLDTDSEIFGAKATEASGTGDTAVAAADADVDCSSTGTAIVTYLVGDDSPLQDKDPYDGGNAFVSTASGKPEGDTVLTGTSDNINVKTQYNKPGDGEDAEYLENDVGIE